MSRIIPALIFTLMAVADGRLNRRSPDEENNFGDNFESNFKPNTLISVKQQQQQGFPVCEVPLGKTDKDTVYVFEPIYSESHMTGLKGLNVKIDKQNSKLKCVRKYGEDEPDCCMPFDYNDQTIKEIKCSQCNIQVKMKDECPVAKWEPSTCVCKVTKGEIMAESSHYEVKKGENGEDGIKMVCGDNVTDPRGCTVEFTLAVKKAFQKK